MNRSLAYRGPCRKVARKSERLRVKLSPGRDVLGMIVTRTKMAGRLNVSASTISWPGEGKLANYGGGVQKADIHKMYEESCGFS